MPFILGLAGFGAGVYLFAATLYDDNVEIKLWLLFALANVAVIS